MIIFFTFIVILLQNLSIWWRGWTIEANSGITLKYGKKGALKYIYKSDLNIFYLQKTKKIRLGKYVTVPSLHTLKGDTHSNKPHTVTLIFTL